MPSRQRPYRQLAQHTPDTLFDQVGSSCLRKVGGLTAWDNIELREAERRNAEGGPTTTAETHLATIAAARGWFKIESGNARSPQEVAELAVERILLTLGGRAAPTPSQ